MSPQVGLAVCFSYSSSSNPDYPNAERQQNHLEIPNFSQSNLMILRFVDKPEFFDARLWRVAGSGHKFLNLGFIDLLSDSRSMKPRFRNANLLITHVFDTCVELLAVLHISHAQGRSVDLCMEIATD